MKIKNLAYNFQIAGEAILQHKLRSVLTSLGIIFGVASVIAMLAIGSGAEQQILEKMRLLGTNVVIIKPIEKKKLLEDEKKANEEKENEQTGERISVANKYTPGLTLADARAIKRIIPHADLVSSEIVMETMSLREGLKRTVKLVGIELSYFNINNFKLFEGAFFNQKNMEFAESVCIIGSGVKTKLFAREDPVGKSIKCGNHWLTVMGVLNDQTISKENLENLKLRDYNFDIYVPINTMLVKYANRSLITKQDLQRGSRYYFVINSEKEDDNYNQVDKITVSFNVTEKIKESSDIISRMLERKHNGVKDFEVVVPELLLQQEQETKRIFNIVLFAIASISLIVGGIGIMNIMLASVLERTKEIGIRKAIGAKKVDILLQFLSEAVAISLTGGIIGIIVGVSGSYIIEFLTDIKTIVTPLSVIISFFVSISVGIIFGIAPARKASQEDPIDLLRYE
jgi:putative ABC transport system permease protein